MVRLTAKCRSSAQVQALSKAVVDRVEFRTGGALSGHADGSRGAGRLPDEWRGQWTRDLPDVDYVVYSYATPIAWHTRVGDWTVPPVTYSQTTTGHQGRVRDALRDVGYGNTVSEGAPVDGVATVVNRGAW